MEDDALDQSRNLVDENGELQFDELDGPLINWLIGRHKGSGVNHPQMRDIILVDQADVEIIKVNFMGMMIDISIG
jgi:hypothetical protein